MFASGAELAAIIVNNLGRFALADHPTIIDGIIVRCEQDSIYYPGLVDQALGKIASRRLGRSLLQSISKRGDRRQDGFAVVIHKPRCHGTIEGIGGPLVNTWTNKAVRFNEENACNRTGTRTAVSWNPNILVAPDGARPPFIALAHELIHAMQNLRGTAFADIRREEFSTVGLYEYANRRKRNENAIRAEHGLPAREAYYGLSRV